MVKINHPSEDVPRVGSASWVRFGLALSPRERRAILLTAHGMSGKQIAEEMTISLGTVKNHRSNAYIKMGVYSGAEAVAHMMVKDDDFFEEVKAKILEDGE